MNRKITEIWRSSVRLVTGRIDGIMEKLQISIRVKNGLIKRTLWF